MFWDVVRCTTWFTAANLSNLFYLHLSYSLCPVELPLVISLFVGAQVVLTLREDGATAPEAVSKWADEANWMGGDAVVLAADTAEVSDFLC